MIEWILPLQIVSPNVKEHWAKTFARNKSHKIAICAAWAQENHKPSPPSIVSLQRMYNPSKREKRWDDDNWIAGCKGIRDIIAALIVHGLAPGQADNPKYGLTFEYDQLKCQRSGIRIIIKSQEELEDERQ